MNRLQLEKFIFDNYSVKPDYPFGKYPSYAVFRNEKNKWFAVIMTIDKSKLCPAECGQIDVVNLKCDGLEVLSFKQEKGVYPAYHMNKNHWITVELDVAHDDFIKMLVDVSYNLVDKKRKSTTK